MMSELEAMTGGDLVMMVFLCGSAAMLIVSMIAVTWLCEAKRSRASRRVGRTEAAFVNVARRRS